MKKTLVFLLALLLLPALAAPNSFAEIIYEHTASNVKSSTGEPVYLYAEPSTDSEIIAELNDGAYALIVLQDNEEWAHIDIDLWGELAGYVLASELVVNSDKNKEEYYDTYGKAPIFRVIPKEEGGLATLYKTADLNSEIEGKLCEGALVQVAARTGKFSFISMGQGVESCILTEELEETSYEPMELRLLPSIGSIQYKPDTQQIYAHFFPSDEYRQSDARTISEAKTRGFGSHVIADLGDWLQIEYNYIIFFLKTSDTLWKAETPEAP